MPELKWDAQTGSWISIDLDRQKKELKEKLKAMMRDYSLELARLLDLVMELMTKIFQAESASLTLANTQSDLLSLRQKPRIFHVCICLPLVTRGELFGILKLDHKTGNKKYTPDDLNLILSLIEPLTILIEQTIFYQNSAIKSF